MRIYFFHSFFGPGPGEALWMLDGPWRLYCSDKLDGILGLLFLSSFAMRSFGGSAKAYGDAFGSKGTHSRLFNCMLWSSVHDIDALHVLL
jgi:hypothetical protein